MRASNKGPFIYYIIADRGEGSPQFITDYIGVGRPIEMFFIWMISVKNSNWSYEEQKEVTLID